MMSILDLPTELLSMIFTHLTPLVNKNPETQPCSCRRMNFFAVRSTCQKFRAVTNELPIWYNEDFKLIEMIPPPQSWNTEYDCHDYNAGFLEVLFQDRHLVKSLARRKSWHFKSLETLLAVDEHIPSFRRNTTAVQLMFSSWSASLWTTVNWEPSSLDDTIRHLNVCRHLRSLAVYLTPDEESLDLTLIAMACPFLRVLRLTGIDSTEGSLKSLSKLESFVANDLSPAVCGTILPIKSAKTLNHLAILYSDSDFACDFACINGTFDLFVNLTSLFVHPLSDPMCDVIIHANFNLKEFRTTVYEDGIINIRKVISLFSTVSLRNLQMLRITFSGPDAWGSHFAGVAQCITANLVNLQELVLGMGMDTTWSAMFTRLSKLRRLVWYVQEDDWYDPARFGGDEDLDLIELAGNLKLMSEIAIKRFDAAFCEFAERPVIDIEVYREHIDGCICECNMWPILYEDNFYVQAAFMVIDH
jgi:hypothetical protein